MDFASDSLMSGRRIRIMTIADLWNRSSPALKDERLNQNVLLTLHDARRSVEIWRQDLQQAETTQLIGLADLGRISRKKYNMNPLETTNVQVIYAVGKVTLI